MSLTLSIDRLCGAAAAAARGRFVLSVLREGKKDADVDIGEHN
jgi:hypothetical protein